MPLGENPPPSTPGCRMIGLRRLFRYLLAKSQRPPRSLAGPFYLFHAASILFQLHSRLPRVHRGLRGLARPRARDRSRWRRAALCGTLRVEHPALPAGGGGTQGLLGVCDPNLRAWLGDLPGLCVGMCDRGRGDRAGLRHGVPSRRRGMPRGGHDLSAIGLVTADVTGPRPGVNAAGRFPKRPGLFWIYPGLRWGCFTAGRRAAAYCANYRDLIL